MSNTVNPWFPPPNLGNSFLECLSKLLSVIAEQHVVSEKVKKVFYVYARATARISTDP